MMTTTDIAKEMYKRCAVFNTETFIRDNVPFEPIEQERIVIIASRVVPNKYWHDCNVKIDWCVPDNQGEEDGIRIEEVEKILDKTLSYGIGTYEGRVIRFKKNYIDTDGVAEGKYHFVCLEVKFQIQNIK